MLIQLGAARDGGADRQLAWSLAAIAGTLNAAGFYAVGLYSSNMTGNVSALADHLATADIRAAGVYFSLVLTFISGAAVSALLINAGRRLQIGGIYALSILVEGVLLACLASADLWLAGAGRGPLLVYGLSFLMGLQNAVVTRISNARVRTTHVTGMVTDIGIELGNLLDLFWQRRWNRNAGLDAQYDKEKLRLHGLTVMSFLAGGVVGVLAFKALGPCFLFAASALLLLLSLPGILRSRAMLIPRREGG